MPTRSEQAKIIGQRKGPGAKQRKKHAAKAMREEKRNAHENQHAGRKATYALETRQDRGRASRKSTRRSANRAKATATFDIREGLVKGTPSARAARRAAGQRGGVPVPKSVHPRGTHGLHRPT
jgi:hypothetical protein